MLEILYYMFIFPLQSLLGLLLDSLHSLTNNYGVSIILLSLLVNIFLLKLARIAEAKAQATNALKSTCDKKIIEFKRVFKGAELQSYIRTLYRQKHYHPIFALSALGGLALQVPFFIAVFCLLQEFDGIKSVSFLWIGDLSAPDLVAFGGFSLHLLPILMTAISLLNVWIVANYKGARIQGALISLIFLVLLYKMPSALVLYWTTNMAFSLSNSLLGMRFRRFGKSKSESSLLDLSPKQSKINCHIERSEISQKNNRDSSLQATLSAQNDNIDCHDSTQCAESRNDRIDSPSLADGARGWVKLSTFFIFRKPLKIAFITLTSILILGLCITFALMLYAKDRVQSAPITLDNPNTARIHFGKWDFLLRSSSISKVKLVSIKWDKRLDSSAIKVTSNAKRFVHFASETFLDLDKGTNMGQISYIMNFTPLMQNLFRYYFGILGAVLWIYLSLCIVVRFQRYEPQHTRIYRQIATYAILCSTFLICVFSPYQLYSTDITQFDSSQTYATLSALFGAFVLISFVLIYALSFVPKRFSHIVAFILSVILFSGVVYSFILVGDYGAMDRFIFQKAPQKNALQVVECAIVLLLGIALVAFALTRLKRALQIIFATLIIVSGVQAVQIVSKRVETNTPPQTPRLSGGAYNDSPSLALDDSKNSPSLAEGDKGGGYDSAQNHTKPPYEDELFSYSKNDKNIVVLVLDAFSGSHTPYILEQFPQFKTQLDGFTLFPNAISSSASTIISITSLIAGEYYVGYNVNKRQKPLQESINEGFLRIGEHFADSGYNVGIYTALAWMEGYELFSSPKFYNADNENLFIDYFIENNKGDLQNIDGLLTSAQKELPLLLQFGLFRFVPNTSKTNIYNNGNWHFVDMAEANIKSVVRHASTTYAFTHIGNVDSAKPTFKFFHSVMTHTPYGIYFKDGKCRYGEQKSAWEDYPHNVEMLESKAGARYQHYDTEICALSYLADYIAWLKNAEIYDNTQIFVVSDHGNGNAINLSLPNIENPNPDTLLLFKDFGTRGGGVTSG